MGAGYGGWEKPDEELLADGIRGGGVDEFPGCLWILKGATVDCSPPGAVVGLFKKSSSSGLPCFCDDMETIAQAVGRMAGLLWNRGSNQGKMAKLGDDLGVTADMDKVVGL